MFINESIKIPEKEDLSGYLRYYSNLNKSIKIPDCAVNLSGFFKNCDTYNQPVTIPSNVKNCSGMFFCCEAFNQSVYLPPSVEDCRSMFRHCNNFDKPVNLPNGVKFLSGMFSHCKSFNKPLIIPESVEDCNYMLQFCTTFNQSVIFEGDLNSTIGMFEGCIAFNKSVVLPPTIKSINSMFKYCESFNQPLTIPDSVEDCRETFECTRYNQPIKLPDNSKLNCQFMFGSNPVYNQEITIPNPYVNCDRMFLGCDSMQSNVYCTEEQYNDMRLSQYYSWSNGVAKYNGPVREEVKDEGDISTNLTNLFINKIEDKKPTPIRKINYKDNIKNIYLIDNSDNDYSYLGCYAYNHMDELLNYKRDEINLVDFIDGKVNMSRKV
jgi:hypothetical protein